MSSKSSVTWIICKVKSTLESLHLKIILRISGMCWFSHILPLLQRKAMQFSKKKTTKATHSLCSERASPGNTLYSVDLVLATGRGSGINQRLRAGARARPSLSECLGSSGPAAHPLGRVWCGRRVRRADRHPRRNELETLLPPLVGPTGPGLANWSPHREWTEHRFLLPGGRRGTFLTAGVWSSEELGPPSGFHVSGEQADGGRASRRAAEPGSRGPRFLGVSGLRPRGS